MSVSVTIDIEITLFMTHTLLSVTRKYFFEMSSNFEANASELLENLEEMFPDSTTLRCLFVFII